jgi:LuxR family transcriptional regulator, activator of conjugal transfer of Ti plasmids
MTTLHGSLPERLESFIRDIDEAATLDAILTVLTRQLPVVGFDYFAYWLIWPPEGMRQPLCLTNYPGDWAQYYLEQNYASHDYVGRFAAKSTVPFIWNNLAQGLRLTERQKTIFHEGKAAGLKAGGTVPIHGPAAAKATFSVANDMSDPEFEKLFTRHRHEIHLMATYVHEKIIGLGLHNPLKSPIKLTPRETEILTWSAKGKSRWETGVILGIAEDTVRAHLENIRKKTGAANTTHAIATALLHGLLLP